MDHFERKFIVLLLGFIAGLLLAISDKINIIIASLR